MQNNAYPFIGAMRADDGYAGTLHTIKKKKMKAITIIIFCLPQIIFGQIGEITFSNDSSAFQNILESNIEAKINDIIIKEDFTFEFWSRPFHSCYSWTSCEGTWTKNNDTLIFNDSYEVFENHMELSYQRKKNQDYFQLEFCTNQNSKLKEKNVEVEFTYDFDAEKENIKRVFELDSTNQIKILFEEIPVFEQLASIRIDYLLDGKYKRVGYITENDVLNQRKGNLPNIIQIKIIENPRIEIVLRTSKAVIDNDILKVISSTQTESDLSDFYAKIKFEDYYKIEK